MKKIITLLIGLIIFIPSVVLADSGTITISAPSTAIVGNTITVTVKLSTGASWEADLSYDKNYLQMTQAGGEGGGTYMANTVVNNKNRSYTFKFKVIKNGSTTLKIANQYVVADNFETVKMTSNSKTISIKTKEEVEASYSDDATLKNLTVEGFELTPKFNSSTAEYNLEVENNQEKVNITATKNNANAKVVINGEENLSEGINKFEIIVTAQKGNSKTYILNINRKELDPINITFEGNEYTVVRKSDFLEEKPTFTLTTVTYNDTEIPALHSDITDYTIIGLKDNDGNISYFILKDNKIVSKYNEIKSNQINLYPLELKESSDFNNYKVVKVEINGVNTKGYVLDENSKQIIIYAKNIETGEDNYYTYSKTDSSVQVYNDEITKFYEQRINNYKYVLLGLIILNIILIFIIIITRRPKKQKYQEIINNIDKNIDEEIETEIIEKK